MTPTYRYTVTNHTLTRKTGQAERYGPPAPDQFISRSPRVTKAAAINPERGRRLWTLLHQRALETDGPDADWLARFARMIPCGRCRRHWNAFTAANPVAEARSYFLWTVQAHNSVNRALGKPEMTAKAALALWTPLMQPKAIPPGQ